MQYNLHWRGNLAVDSPSLRKDKNCLSPTVIGYRNFSLSAHGERVSGKLLCNPCAGCHRLTYNSKSPPKGDFFLDRRSPSTGGTSSESSVSAAERGLVASKAMVTTKIRLRFDCNRPHYDRSSVDVTTSLLPCDLNNK